MVKKSWIYQGDIVTKRERKIKKLHEAELNITCVESILKYYHDEGSTMADYLIPPAKLADLKKKYKEAKAKFDKEDNEEEPPKQYNAGGHMQLIQAHYVNWNGNLKIDDGFTFKANRDTLILEYDIGWIFLWNGISENDDGIEKLAAQLEVVGWRRTWYGDDYNWQGVGARLCDASDSTEKILNLIKEVPPIDLLDGLLMNNKVAVYLRDIGIINGGSK